MLQDVGVSWEYTGDTNRHPLALEQAELAEVMTAWPLLCVACGLAWLSADPKQVLEKLGTCRTDELKSRLGLDEEAES